MEKESTRLQAYLAANSEKGWTEEDFQSARNQIEHWKLDIALNDVINMDPTVLSETQIKQFWSLLSQAFLIIDSERVRRE